MQKKPRASGRVRNPEEYARRRYIAQQIEAQRRKLLHLEREALRYGMPELVRPYVGPDAQEHAA
jgi:hypothetical protein